MINIYIYGIDIPDFQFGHLMCKLSIWYSSILDDECFPITRDTVFHIVLSNVCITGTPKGNTIWFMVIKPTVMLVPWYIHSPETTDWQIYCMENNVRAHMRAGLDWFM